MAQRVNAESGLVDGMTADLGGPRMARLLDRLDKSVSWKELIAPIARLPEYREKRGVGRPAWQPETMLRALLLAKWFNLSDPQLEECLKDRLSFRRFVGLRLTDAMPDDGTFIDELTEKEESMVVADAAYRSEERERRLLARGVTSVIAYER